MNDYGSAMIIGDRVRKLRERHGLTQEDLAAKSGVSLASIQRTERGDSISGNTLACVAAAFGVPASELTIASGISHEPYLPLEPVKAARALLSLLPSGVRLDFDFVELSDLAQAELVQEFQEWCEFTIQSGLPHRALARVKVELEATDLIKRLAEAHLTISGATYTINIYEVDDEFDSMPVLLAQWDQDCSVIRIGCKNKWVNRGYVMGQLGKWESPAGDRIIYPNRKEEHDLDFTASF